jgi:DNA-binding GntR family transcriptional regulator
MPGASRFSSSSAGRSGRLDLPALTPLPTAAERAAEVIREHIFNGEFAPETPLPETTVAQALHVSRNTVRDAFRMLINEHLLAYEVNRGVSVRSLGADDLADIYALRKMFELPALDRMAQAGEAPDLAALRDTVAAAERAKDQGDWTELGTRNLVFHAQIVAVFRSPRIDQFFRRLMTEMRLGFLAIADARALHEPYHVRHRELLALLEAGDFATARAELASYLDDAERQITAAVLG